MTFSTSSSSRVAAALLLFLAVALVAACGAGGKALRPVPERVPAQGGERTLATGAAGRADPAKPGEGLRIAVLPIESLGAPAGGARQLRNSLTETLKEAGFTLLAEDSLEQFMTRHRIRYVGGIDTETSRAFLQEAGVHAVLVTSLELYSEVAPPKIALFCRLVSTGAKPEILWMDGVGMSGNDAPGILELGVIENPSALRKKALRQLVKSLSGRLAGKSGHVGVLEASKRFQPKITYNSSYLKKGKRYSVGVVPFSNMSERNRAGEIMALHFAAQLSQLDDFTVVEPGVVREKLLGLRIIMQEGLSRRELYSISSGLETDLLLTGKVDRYEDSAAGGVPKVEFSVLMMEADGKDVVLASQSYNAGNDGVFFFDAGSKSTAMETASQMVRALVANMEKSRGAPGRQSVSGTDYLQWLQVR